MRLLFTILAGAVTAAGCSPPPPPPLPDPPRVSLVSASANVADTRLELTLNISGCDDVSVVDILDRGRRLQSVAFTGNPTIVTLAPNAFVYDTIAANLSLVAKATCTDGRVASSSPASVRYLPVQDVVRGTAGPVVTDVFLAEGKDANVGFLGCSGNGNGTTAILRVDRLGEVKHFNLMPPFACTNALWFTDRNLSSGKRWMVEPGQGAAALDPVLNVTGFINGAAQLLGVGPDGDAVVYFGGSGGGGGEYVQRIAHAGGQVKWTFQLPGQALANPVIQSAFGVYVPLYIDNFGALKGTIAVQRIDYETGVATTADQSDLQTVTYQTGDLPPKPAMAFNNDGTIAYTAFQQVKGSSVVTACASNVPGCSGTARKWQSLTLPGVVSALIPYANGSIIAAITPQFVWFLDASNGFLLNKEGKPISPEGALVTMGVQPGLERDFYILTGTGFAGSLPVEVIAVDDPASGELYRYSVSGYSLMAGVDAGGRLWLRTGNDLALTLPIAEYQQVAQR